MSKVVSWNNLPILRFLQSLEKSNTLSVINESLKTSEYSTSSIGVPEIKHFLYKSKTAAQVIQILLLSIIIHDAPRSLLWMELAKVRCLHIRARMAISHYLSLPNHILTFKWMCRWDLYNCSRRISALHYSKDYRLIPLHFQFTSSKHSQPYVETQSKERLHKIYLYLQGKLHSTSRPLKLVYYSGQKENVIAWVCTLSRKKLFVAFFFFNCWWTHNSKSIQCDSTFCHYFDEVCHRTRFHPHFCHLPNRFG